MQIEDMTAADLPAILEVENRSFARPWTKNMFLEELSGRFSVYRVAIEDGRAVGYMGMWILADEGHITNVAVLPAFRRRGFASALIDDFIALAREKKLVFLTLEVRASNTGAIALYHNKGFVEAGRRKNYYENKEDAILMTKYFEYRGNKDG